MNRLSLILGVLLVIAIGTAGFFWWQSQQDPGQALGPYTPPSVSESPTLTAQDQTGNWKTYSNSSYGVAFKYPVKLSVYGEISGPATNQAIRLISLGDETTGIPGTDGAFDGLSVYVVPNPTKQSLNDFVEDEKGKLIEFAEIFNGPTDQSKQVDKVITVAGEPARKVSGYSWDGIIRYYVQLPGGNFLEISELNSSSSFPNIFQQILSTFEFTD